MRYPKYLLALDAFGLLAVLSCVLYCLVPSSWQPQQRLDDLWGGLSTEALGIWAGVRFIDWVIKSHEDSTKARVRIVRNMRFLERACHQVLEFRRSHEYRDLLRNWKWENRIFERRQRHLSDDEIEDVRSFHSLVGEFVSRLPQGLVPFRSDIRLADADIEGLAGLSTSIEDARQKAEANILQETDEDEGL